MPQGPRLFGSRRGDRNPGRTGAIFKGSQSVFEQGFARSQCKRKGANASGNRIFLVCVSKNVFLELVIA